MIEITNDVFIDPKEVCGIENDYATDYYGEGLHKGVVITLKCGRKIYVKKSSAKDIFAMIETQHQQPKEES